MNPAFRPLLPLALALCLGCHPQIPAQHADALAQLRKDAAAQPNDAELAVRLALAEQLGDHGDPHLGVDALTRARALSPGRIELLYVDAETHVLEGRAEEAFQTYIALVLHAVKAPDAPHARALAELSLHALVDMNDAVANYRPRVSKLLEAIAPHARSLGLTAAHQVALQRSGFAMQQGNLAEAVAALDAAGCVRTADVAGPFGPRALLAFDTALPPEKPGPFAAAYDLGEGRKTEKVRRLDTHRCVLALGRGAHDAMPGVSYMRTELEVQVPGTYAMRVESPNSYALWLDGKELTRVDLRTQAASGARYALVTLSAGRHELKAKVSSRHPNPALLLAFQAASEADLAQIAIPESQDPFDRYVATKLSLARGDVLGARERIRTLGLEAPTAHWLVLAAGVALADPLRAPEQRRDTARMHLTKARAANPAAWFPTVGLANLEAAEGRAKEATDLLEVAAERYPGALAAQTAWIEQLSQRGFDEAADRVLEALSERLPDACALAVIRMERAREHSRMAEVERETERVMACDAAANARYRLLLAKRDYNGAATELARLRALGEPPDAAQRIDAALELSELRGEHESSLSLREARSAYWPDRPGPVLDQADRLLATGKRSQATAFLAQAIEAHPSELADASRVYEGLSGNAPFASLRRDSRDVIARFEASGEAYNGPQLLLLDYTIVRVFPDGSSVELTHNIIRVQSEEAVDEAGEFSVPDGARLLTLRTIKADGRRLEPDPIAGKSSWSLPGLAPGDYVEFETLKTEAPSIGFPGGYLGDRFYFKSFEVPFHRSELVILVPNDMAPVLDPRGDAPVAEKTSHEGLSLLRWAVDKSRALPMEPGSVAMREYVPSINVGTHVSFARYVESLRDILADKDPYDPEAAAFVQSMLSAVPAESTAEKVSALHAWVTEQIEATDEVFGNAPAMLAARTGSRERVLRYLLGLAGVPADLALVRGIEADHTDGKLPDPETYGYLLLRLHEDLPVRWLHAGTRYAPAGYLPPQVRGERALMLTPTAETTSVPSEKLESSLREIDADIRVDASGHAVVHVREKQRGGMAFALRDNLDEIPESELKTRFEQSYATSVLPGARLASLDIKGRDDRNAALELDYTLEVGSLGHRAGDDLRIPGLFVAGLQARHARMHSRTTTALVAPDQASDIRVRVHLPAGATLAAAPKAASLSHPSGAHYAFDVQTEPGTLTLTRTLRLPVTRIPAADYPAFAEFCRSVDTLEAADVAMHLPAP
jgi:hypothetical protein